MNTIEYMNKKWAYSYLDAKIMDYIMTSPGPVRTSDVVHYLGETLGVSARLVRNHLNQSRRLTSIERRWDLRVRHENRHRPIEGFIRWLLRERGLPLSETQLVSEVARFRGCSQDSLIATTLHRLISTRPYYFLTRSGECGLREWLMEFISHDEEGLQKSNFWENRADLETQLQNLDFDYAVGLMDPLEVAVSLLETSSQPIHNKVLNYAVWKVLGHPFDPLELFESMRQDHRVILLPGPLWCNPRVLETIQESVVEWSIEVDEAAVGEDQVNLEEVLGQEVVMGKEAEVGYFTLTEDDLKEVIRVIEENNAPTSLAVLVTDALELFPGDTLYIQALQRLHERLLEDDRFVLMGDHQWYLRSLLPPTLHRVPVTLEPSPIQVLTLTGEPVDVLLSDEGLEGFLAFEVHAPDMEDIGEEHEVGEIKAGTKLVEKVRYVTNYRHYVAGTLKVRKIDRGVFPAEPTILPLQLVDKVTSYTFEAWLNNESGLLCGLASWYSERLPPAGGVFYAEATSDPKVIHLTVQTEPDPYLFIPPARIEELLLLRSQWEHNSEKSVLELMQHIMSEYPEGISFRKLYSEINVIRRVTKRLVASNLSSYPMFQPHAVEEGLWVFDPSKANRGRLAAKRAFIISANV